MAGGTWRKLAANGWIQDQHGAWPMALVPVTLGATIGGWMPRHFLLFVAWFSGFHLFHSATLWAKARSSATRRKRYLPALRMWALFAALTSGCLVFFFPITLLWAPMFAPLIAISAWESWQKRDRSILARLSTITASSAMLPLATWLHEVSNLSIFLPANIASWYTHVWPSLARTLGFPEASAHGYSVWLITAVLWAYFVTSVPYVRSLIRGRNNARWWGVAVLSTGAVTATLFWAQWTHRVVLSPIVLALWLALIARATLVPWLQRRGTPVRPAAIGAGEFLVTAILALTLMA